MIETGAALVDLACADRTAEYGAKAVNLGRVLRLGMPTPTGVVIPDRLLQHHLQRCGAAARVATLQGQLERISSSALERASACIRARICDTSLERSLREALASTYRARWPGLRLAVRSSAVGEDSLQASFAGQLDSFLHVDSLSALEKAILRTWASLFAPRVLLYARDRQFFPSHMGVIVQAQVDARLSGVLFTRDPTGQRDEIIVVEYCTGLGDRLVSGAITPSRLSIRRTDRSIELEHPAKGENALEASDAMAVVQIAGMALELEKHFGVTQDVEWCIGPGDEPFLLQTRPARCATRRRMPEHTMRWTNANIAENFPAPVTPFLYSIVKPGYSSYFRNLGLGFGVSRIRIDTMHEALRNIVGLHAGRLYYNLSNIHTLLHLMPAGRWLVNFFNLFVGAESIPAPAAVPLSFGARVIETVRIVTCTTWQYLLIERRMRAFEARADAFAVATRPEALANETAEALAGHLRRFLDIRFNRWNDAAIADAAAMACYGLLKSQLARSLAGDDSSTLHNSLLKGLPELCSAMPVTKLWELSRRVRDDPRLYALFTRDSVDTIFSRLAAPEYREFRQAFSSYLDQWGFRSSGELMLTAPTPAEEPRPLLELLQAYVRAAGSSPESLVYEQRRASVAAATEIARRLTPWSLWRAVPLLSRAGRFRLLLGATRGAIKLRERARMKQALLYTRLRHVALNIGRRLVDRGVLTDRGDVFLLSTDEVLALLAASATTDGSTAALVEARRAAMEACRAQQPPDHLDLAAGEHWSNHFETFSKENERSPDRCLRGTGACSGTATGVAAVVVDVAQASRIAAQQILVTRQTDPGWAAVFFLIKGLVIERGGMLSHGAIIAREYGIPAVVGVANATRLIRDGDNLHVDGDHGVVWLGDS